MDNISKRSRIKTLFFGSSTYSIGVFDYLIKSEDVEIIGVVTQPDKPVGRKKELTPTVFKQHVINNYPDIKISSPASIRKSAEEILEEYSPECIIVASYGQIIPNSILEYPKYKCLNFHVSLLPELRGAVPMPMAILQGLEETGVTLQIMAEKMDEGDIVSQIRISISDTETTETLENKSILASGEIIRNDLPKWFAGQIVPVAQDHSKATYCYISDLKKENGEITESDTVESADRKIRAFYPSPIAWVTIPNGKYAGKRLKIYSADIISTENLSAAGAELVNKDKKLVLSLKVGQLELIEVQLEGKSKASGEESLYLVG